MKHRIAILASGAGSNARNIIEYSSDSRVMDVVLIASNRIGAGVLEIAGEYNIETFVLDRSNFIETNVFIELLEERTIDFIVLAGFLWRIPASLVREYDRRIVNIHPALLPRFGGKGMYGRFVHEAVHAAEVSESGITIHYVDDHYDEGDIIFQATVEVSSEDSPSDIEQKVRALEMEHYPKIIEDLLK